MIISRYIRRELSYTVITVTAILVLIGMSNQIATILGKAVHGQLAKDAVLYIVAFSMPYFLTILIPIGVFIAVYTVFTRLYYEQEMIILQMSGIDNSQVIKIIALPLAFITIFTAFINFWLAPAVLRYRDILMEQAAVIDAVTMLAEGHFQMVAGGKYVIYVQSADSKKRTLSHIFVAEQPKEPSVQSTKTKPRKDKIKNDRWDIFVSREGREVELPEMANKRFVIMKDGFQYQGLPGTNEFYRLKFSDYGFELPQQNVQNRLHRHSKKTTELLTSDNLRDQAELQTRLNFIISPIALAFLALAFSKLQPRQSRFARLLPAIIVTLVYYNLMLASEDWIARGVIPVMIGSLWLHAIIIAGSCYMLFKKTG